MRTLLLKLIQFFMVIGVTIGATICYPILLIGSFFWFKLAVFFSTLNSKTLKGPVKGIETFLAPDKLFKKPNATLIHLAILESTPESKIVSKHLQAIYNLPHEKDVRKYAKLGFSLEPWWGYLFWKEIDNFRIEDQIQFVHNKELDCNSVSQFVEEIIRKPFKKGRPLWEVFVVTKCSAMASQDERRGTKCFIIFRTHHLLLDGMSLIKLWYTADALGDDKFAETIPPTPIPFTYGTSNSLEAAEAGRNFWQRCSAWLNIFYRSPYMGNKYIYYTKWDDNILTKNYKEFSGNWWCSGVNKIHFEKYRQPLRDLKFSLTHALLVGYTRGLKKFVAENYGMHNIPDSVHILGSIPRPNYPLDEALTNHWAVMRYKAELTCESLVGQLEHSRTEYRRAVHDIIPESFVQNHTQGMNYTPYKLYDLLWDTSKSGTLSLSNIPGPKTCQKMFGISVTDRAVWLPLTRHNSGIGLLLLTYNGWGTISLTADSACIKNRKLFNRLNKAIMGEMQFVLDEVLMLRIPIEQDDKCNLLDIKNLPETELHEIKVV